MKKKKLSHVDKTGLPAMVDVSEKKITERIARAQAKVKLPKEIIQAIADDELITKKGPVFQTAILAGIAAAKKTHELIPLCHPLMTEDCQVKISMNKKNIGKPKESRLDVLKSLKNALTFFGLALLVAPWAVGYASESATTNSMVSGILVIGFAVWELMTDREFITWWHDHWHYPVS